MFLKNDSFPVKKSDGEMRHVGFEIEYIDFDIDASIKLLQSLFQGKIVKEHDLSFILKDTRYGDFKVELDFQLLQKLSVRSEKNIKENKIDFAGMTKEVLQKSLEGIVPVEIVTPPMSIDDIHVADKIIDALKKTSAQDTHKNLLCAFGLHINPELPDLSAATILRYLQANCLLNDWLKEQMQVDISRKFSPFIKDYTDDYIQMILSPAYHPDMNTLINDYISHNPSRNYALDVLPVFKYINEKLVTQLVPDEKINARPAFHYRLPNSNFTLKDWSIHSEWDRWVLIEKLAHNDALRQKMSEDYLQLHDALFFKKDKWINLTARYLQNEKE